MLSRLFNKLYALTQNPDRSVFVQTKPTTIGGAYSDFCKSCWMTVDTRTIPDSRCPDCNGPIEFVGTVFRDFKPFEFPLVPQIAKQEPKTEKKGVAIKAPKERPLSLGEFQANALNFLTEFRRG